MNVKTSKYIEDQVNNFFMPEGEDYHIIYKELDDNTIELLRFEAKENSFRTPDLEA